MRQRERHERSVPDEEFRHPAHTLPFKEEIKIHFRGGWAGENKFGAGGELEEQVGQSHCRLDTSCHTEPSRCHRVR